MAAEKKAHDEHYKDFSNRTAYNGVETKEGEVLVPFVVSKEAIKTMDLPTEHMETWPMRNGRKITVGFTVTPKEQFEVGMKDLNVQIHEEILSITNTTDHRDDENDSLDEITDAITDPDQHGVDPTGTEELDNAEKIKQGFADLLTYYERMEMYREEKIMLMFFQGYLIKEIAAEVFPELKSSQAYTKINKIREDSHELFLEKFDYR